VPSDACAPGRVYDSASGQCFVAATQQALVDNGSCGSTGNTGSSGFTFSVGSSSVHSTTPLGPYELTVSITPRGSSFGSVTGTAIQGYRLVHASQTNFSTAHLLRCANRRWNKYQSRYPCG
jgi:hypothetical protein